MVSGMVVSCFSSWKLAVIVGSLECILVVSLHLLGVLFAFVVVLTTAV